VVFIQVQESLVVRIGIMVNKIPERKKREKLSKFKIGRKLIPEVGLMLFGIIIEKIFIELDSMEWYEDFLVKKTSKHSFYFQVDLRVVTPGKGGYYYPEHTPLLGKINLIFSVFPNFYE
jgi:hypothetical protein